MTSSGSPNALHWPPAGAKWVGWNARSAVTHDGKTRSRKVAFIGSLFRGHTLVCIQETRAGQESLRVVLRPHLRRGVVFSSGGEDGLGGVATFARNDFLPGATYSYIDIIKGRLLEISTKKDNLLVHIINLHLYAFNTEDLNIMKQHINMRLEEHVHDPVNCKVIFMGDFNMHINEAPTYPAHRIVKAIADRWIELDPSMDTHYNSSTKKFRQIDRAFLAFFSTPASPEDPESYMQEPSGTNASTRTQRPQSSANPLASHIENLKVSSGFA